MDWNTDVVIPAIALLSGVAGLFLLRASLRKAAPPKPVPPIEKAASYTTGFSRVSKIY